MADPLRITFVAMAYAPSVGGSQRHVQRLAEGLAARGHDVDVLTTDVLTSVGARDPGRIEQLDEVIGGVRVRRHRTPDRVRRAQRAVRGVWLRRPGGSGVPDSRTIGPWMAGPLSPSLVASVRRALRDRDVVVACSAPYTTFVAPPRLRRRRAAVVGMPLLHLARAEVSAGVRRALARCDALVAFTEPERDAQRRSSRAGAPLHVVPPGTDVDGIVECSPAEARLRLGLPERPTVGYVGRFTAYKGVDTLVAAAPHVWASRADVGVLVAGRPAGFDVARAAAAIGADERLVVREDFPEGDRGLVLAACDVIAVVSRDESFGLVISEGWAARRPVVVGDIPAVRSVVRPGIDAEVVPVDEPEALAQVVVDLLGDPDRCAALAAAGRRRVDEELCWPVVVDRWDEVVRGAATRRSRKAVA